MCGIAGFYLRDPELPVNRDALTSTLLAEIEYRGRDATGVVALDADGVAEWQKAACEATIFNRYRRILPSTTRTMLGHTRWATQGLPAFMENNHPIRRGPFYIIHNGHVSNDNELFEKSERHRFGEVDSEAIAAHLAHLGDLALLPEVMEEIDGDAAVGAVDERDCARLALARGRSSPLWIYNGTKIVIFASLESAVVKAHAQHVGQISTKRLFSLKEGFFLEWRGSDDYDVQQFKPKERKWTYTPATTTVKWPPTWEDLDNNYGYGGYAWESSLDRQLQAVAKDEDDEEVIKATPGTGRSRDPNEDTIACDNCGQVAFWDEAEYRWVRGENVTFILCQSCADEFDEDEWIDALWDDEDEVDEDGFSFRRFDPDLNDFDPTDIEIEDIEIIDDYANANESIIRSLTRKILKGGTDAV